MKKNLTEIVFILDRSGSMKDLEKDTIGGYNSYLEKQKREEGEALVTTVLFDHYYELLHDRVDINNVQLLTEKEYYARGMTALLDAVGKTISDIEHKQHISPEDEKPEKTIVVIITDGMENSSFEYSYKSVKKMIETQQEKNSWEFIFLGANIDAVEVGGSLGIRAERAVNYFADAKGTAENFEALCFATSEFRSSKGILGSKWREGIDEDFNGR